MKYYPIVKNQFSFSKTHNFNLYNTLFGFLIIALIMKCQIPFAHGVSFIYLYNIKQKTIFLYCLN